MFGIAPRKGILEFMTNKNPDAHISSNHAQISRVVKSWNISDSYERLIINYLSGNRKDIDAGVEQIKAKSDILRGCAESFLQEISLIVLCHILLNRAPSKKELERSSKKLFKDFKNHITKLNDSILEIKGKGGMELYLFQDLIEAKYKEIERSDLVPISVENFLSTIQWLHSTLEYTEENEVYEGYKKFATTSRNKAVIAIAYSYENHFKKPPTSTFPRGSRTKDVYFYDCVKIFLELTKNQNIQIDDFLKDVVRQYKDDKKKRLSRQRLARALLPSKC